MRRTARFEGAREPTWVFFKLFCRGRGGDTQPCIVLSVYKVSQSVFFAYTTDVKCIFNMFFMIVKKKTTNRKAFLLIISK